MHKQIWSKFLFINNRCRLFKLLFVSKSLPKVLNIYRTKIKFDWNIPDAIDIRIHMRARCWMDKLVFLLAGETLRTLRSLCAVRLAWNFWRGLYLSIESKIVGWQIAYSNIHVKASGRAYMPASVYRVIPVPSHEADMVCVLPHSSRCH